MVLEDKICEILDRQYNCKKNCKATFNATEYMLDTCIAIKWIIRITWENEVARRGS